MKKRIVAVLLSLTLSSAMLTEAGAAALPDVTAEAQTADDGMFTDTSGTGTEADTEPVTGDERNDVVDAGTGTEVITGDGAADATEPSVDGEGEIIDDSIIVEEETGEKQETPDVESSEVQPEIEFTDGLFVSEPDAVNPDLKAEEEDAQAAAASVEAEGKLLYTRWQQPSSGKWKLQKLPEAAPDAQTADTVQVSQDAAGAADQVLEDSEAAAEIIPAAENETPAVGETESPDMSVPAEESLTEEEDSAAEAGEDAAEEYYTAADGLVTITTIDVTGKTLATGTYLFDENGYLVTGRKVVKKGTPGFSYGSDAEFYFLPAAKATVTNTNTEAGKNLTPYNSKLGQMQKNVDWLWDGGAFHNYGSDGRAETIAANKIYKIGSDYYYLLSGGKPYVGQKKTTYNNRTGLYYFGAASSSTDIPGKMKRNAWVNRSMPKGTQWLYFGNDGRWEKKGCGAYKVLPSRDALYLLDNNGYLVKNKQVKAANGYYYMSNKYAQVYRNRLIKIGNYRYYFIGDGRRATYVNRWVRLPGAGNRYYYFGSVRGRIQEKRGFQKITVGGKFIGWFYFSNAGNHYIDYFSGGRYFLPDGRMASGVCKVDGRYYFFERSSSTTYRGKMYKGTWIKYNNKYYYAASNGLLATNGWRTIGGSYYYFKNCTALTNYNIKKDNVYGRLDSRGKFVTGWMVANDSKNRARYMDPSTGRFLKNTSKKIDGLLYYFDSNGYRKTDLTNIYKGPYYLEVDRVNGVMTAFNSNRTVPVKTIRVSVGLPSTPTPLSPAGSYYKVKRADRWQLLMGPSWGQYGSHVTGGIYVHSVASGLMNANNLPAGEYLKLGSPASHGCIRCCVADAKWVWENCNGARMKIFDGKYQADECFKGPLGRNPLTPLRGSGTFDPTDPIYN